MFDTVEGFSGERVIEEFEALTKDATRVQRETLQRILRDNGEAEYLQKLGLGGRTDPLSFKSCVPLVTHQDLEPYIQRIADGDASQVLTGRPITSISLSSGTTEGKPKFVPFNEELVQCTMQTYRTSFAFRNSIVHAFRTFELVWEELCNDIIEVVLSSRITIPSIRAAVSRLLFPNPQLADTIYNKCVGLSSWYGVIPELWPNSKINGAYLSKLRHYAGNLPLISADYGASENWIGVNVDPEEPPESAIFTVLPNIGYFEFMPLNEDGYKIGVENSASIMECTEPETVGLTEVSLGKEYEIIITNFAGLYRYRLGDVVKIAGFYNLTPKLQFVRRRNLILTVNIDKNTEKDLQLAVVEATKLLAAQKLEVVDYTSHVDMSIYPGHYVIFLELNGNASDEILGNCCDSLDRSFVDAGYVGSRKIRAIGPLELRMVCRGAFNMILEHYLALGAAMSQFKTPRCVPLSNRSVLQILNSNVIKSYFSTAYD
ncbi:hypothetical protein HPP92_008645 [Vanilla planifolia]|uniref:Uncharacterized protein n=1 Tax=Vanilla planifolia TaxID=51239 RepID=A0A835R2U8_VANPL|nr:hypothetical protein HPP92_008645 [Vanilla planifolia]